MYNDWNDDEDFDGNIEELLREFESIKNGESSRFWSEQEYELVIDYFCENNQEKEALIACELSLIHHPFSTEFFILKAELLFQAQKYRQALVVLEDLESKEKNIFEATILTSEILVAQLKFDEAAALLESYKEIYEGKEKLDLLHELADIYDENEDFDAVFLTLKSILLVDSRNEEALHKICFWADFSDKEAESVKLHLQLLEDDTFNTLAWFNLGVAYQGLKEYEKAIEAYEYCVAIDEKFEFAYRNLAEVYMRLKWYDKAIESLVQNLELGKPEDIIFEAIGHCFDKKKNYGQARFYYAEALKLNPEDDTIFYKIGRTYTSEDNWDNALKMFTKAFELDKENIEYSLAMGNTLVALQQGVDAVACFFNALKIKMNYRKSWISLIRALYVFKLYDEALDNLEEAMKVCEYHAEFSYFHAAILFAMGKSKEALIKLEDGLAASPRKLKILTDLQPEVLQRKSVIDLIATYKRKN